MSSYKEKSQIRSPAVERHKINYNLSIASKKSSINQDSIQKNLSYVDYKNSPQTYFTSGVRLSNQLERSPNGNDTPGAAGADRKGNLPSLNNSHGRHIDKLSLSRSPGRPSPLGSITRLIQE